jgi:hypothetical protein
MDTVRVFEVRPFDVPLNSAFALRLDSKPFTTDHIRIERNPTPWAPARKRPEAQGLLLG